eukprot:1512088-Prymnesium_polylepis.2
MGAGEAAVARWHDEMLNVSYRRCCLEHGTAGTHAVRTEIMLCLWIVCLHGRLSRLCRDTSLVRRWPFFAHRIPLSA